VSSATILSVYNKKLSNMFRGRLVVLTGDTKVAVALRRMAKYNISSVPVIKSRKDNTILGFLDMLDCLAFLCKLIGKEPKEGEKWEINAEELKSTTETFRNTPIEHLVDLSEKNPFYVCHGDQTLSTAVENYLKGAHRIAITDDCGDIIGIISQWTIANYLATVPTDDKDWIPILREPVGKVQFTHEVVSAQCEETTLNCFLSMYRQNVSNLAILDNEGRICGSLSSSDLKGFQLYLDSFGDLNQPVSQFLSLIRKKQGRTERFVVSVTPETVVKNIIETLNEEIIHRVYIVDNDFKPIGVFSLTDLMHQLVVDTHTFSTFAAPTIPEAQ
jgi:CBS domain-containing protein